MSNRYPYETRAIELFIAYLYSVRGERFQIEAEHVQVGTHNCDFMLASVDEPTRRIAVEIVRIVDDETELKQDAFRAAHWSALKGELRTLGVSGVLVRTPWNIPTVPRVSRANAPKLAQRLKAALDARPDDESVSVDGHNVVRLPEFKDVGASANSGAHYVNRPLLTRGLLETLADKELQVDFAGVERVILAVAWRSSLDADELRRELANTDDVGRLRIVERVYHVRLDGPVQLVFARSIASVTQSAAPLPPEDRVLLDHWLAARLFANASGAFSRARAEVLANGGETTFLSRDTREALAHHGAQLVEEGHLADAAWILESTRGDTDPLPEQLLPSGSITTVRGTAAWLAHTLAAHVQREELPSLVRTIGAFATDSNAYVRKMAAFGLRVLMARRDRVGPGSEPLEPVLRQDIYRLWRDYVATAPSDSRGDDAASTLAFIYDLNAEDVIWAFETLRPVVEHDGLTDLTRLVIYFGWTRESDTLMSSGFDGTSIRERVLSLLRSDEDFRSQVAYVVHHNLKNHPETRALVAELVESLLRNGQPGDHNLSLSLECAGLLAEPDLLDAKSDALVCALIAKANESSQDEGFYLAYIVKQIAASLRAANQPDRADRWLQQLTAPELRLIAGP
ncbi:MAG: hypothetical protein JST54_12145 [Deltaproteobacteria bacterium]|nr:hypothetical protein [Deltaproteobacteria bacterium]